MKIFSTLLAICAGNSPVTGESPLQRPVMRTSDVFFDLRLNKRLSKLVIWDAIAFIRRQWLTGPPPVASKRQHTDIMIWEKILVNRILITVWLLKLTVSDSNKRKMASMASCKLQLIFLVLKASKVAETQNVLCYMGKETLQRVYPGPGWLPLNCNDLTKYHWQFVCDSRNADKLTN